MIRPLRRRHRWMAALLALAAAAVLLAALAARPQPPLERAFGPEIRPASEPSAGSASPRDAPETGEGSATGSEGAEGAS